MDTLRIGSLSFAETPFLDVTDEQWQEMIGALELATFELQHFARDCGGEGSAVVVSSAAAARAIEGCTLDGVAGAFLTTVALVGAVELKPRGITVNAVVPARPPDEATSPRWRSSSRPVRARGVTGAVVAADGGFSVTKEVGGKPPLERQ